MQIVATFKGRLSVAEVWNRLKHSNTSREKLFFSHELIMTSAELKAEQMLYFPFCNFAEVHTLALGIAQLLWQLKWVQWWLMHTRGVSCAAVPPHHSPRFMGTSTVIFPFSGTANEFLFVWFSSRSCGPTDKYDRNDAEPFLLAGPTLTQWACTKWLCVKRRDRGVKELLSWCLLLSCLWLHHDSPLTPRVCSWSTSLTQV